MTTYRGRVWKFGDHISTDLVMPSATLYGNMPKEQGLQYCMAAVRPEFTKEVKSGDILVAGRNFGCGSLRPPTYLQELGISCLLANSFSYPFFRYCISLGYPALEHPGISDWFDDGDEAEVDFKRGEIRNLTKDAHVKTKPLPDFIQQILEAGGLMDTFGSSSP